MIENMRALWEALEDHPLSEMPVLDHLDTVVILTCDEYGGLFFTRVPYEDDERPATGAATAESIDWPLRLLVPEEEPIDETPCSEQMWSWDYFRTEQVDPYYMRCHLLGKHDEHENSETGAHWRTNTGSTEREPS